MPGNIYVNQGEIEKKAGEIARASDYFRSNVLEHQDVRTTIPANPDGQAAYGRAQDRMEGLGAALDREVKNIRSLQVSFSRFDEMMGELAKGE